MKNINRLKLLISIILIITLFSHVSATDKALILGPVISNIPEPAPPVSALEHHQTVTNYINRLKSMHNRIFQLVQLTLDTPPRDIEALIRSINSIKSEVHSIRRELREYHSHVQPTGVQTRDTVLLFNILNHINNQLFYLEQLSSTSNKVEKVIQLENFFHARISALYTLIAIEEFLLQP
ncbi:hypothetical protein [Cellulosilyticum sp. I15G10I2]|uniref:hypothetical protein n=1 Tax=Cellulosilyticum sp. I15G10I2 TaxID=1892843 RepID=UPI00085C245A|nr:hypothetical protein [Cellulosilyticum sp. I15G10I2]